MLVRVENLQSLKRKCKVINIRNLCVPASSQRERNATYLTHMPEIGTNQSTKSTERTCYHRIICKLIGVRVLGLWFRVRV